MSLRYKGGVISATPPTPTSSSATGVWTLEQQLQAEAAGNWPSPPPPFGEQMRSLRFNSADSTSLTRTFTSAGNRKTWTWSGWLKRTALSDTYGGALFICSTGSTDSTYSVLWFYANAIRFQAYNTLWRVTSAVYRDLSAWYHVVLAVDTTQATANNRIKLYVNGSQVTDFSTTNNPNQNDDLYINSANLHRIGEGDSIYSNMYLTEVVFVDGQALTPSSFGQTNSTTGVWEPKAITGLTYGTNGFYLNFQDNSGTTATTLGKDSSGNGNNWTPNNFSVTAGVGNDSLVDTPYPYGTDTGAGGEVRGNYCTGNPLDTSSSMTLANGNLQFGATGANAWKQTRCTMSVPETDKWYMEYTISTLSTASHALIGFSNQSSSLATYPGGDATGIGWQASGDIWYSGSYSSPGYTFAAGDVIMFAIDRANQKVWIGKNGTWQNSGNPAAGTGNITSFSGSITTTGAYFPSVGIYSSGQVVYANFGQRPFAYTAPSGFKALCTQNLSTPTVVQGDDYFNTVLYTGTNATQALTTGFQPDLVWIKQRNGTYVHVLFDAVRGRAYGLCSNLLDAEYTSSAGNDLASFDANGFTVGPVQQWNSTNFNTASIVAWNWKANGAGSSNTQGALTGTVSANATAGFSIVTWAASGTYPNTTLGHGLGATPAFIITKSRNNNNSWRIWHKNMATSNNEYYYLGFDNSAVGNFGSNYWVAPTSTIFGGQSSGYDNNVGNMVAYVFAPVAGFSAFGSYTGNGSTDGPFIYTGFRPAFVLVKRTDATENWVIFDNKRDAYNLTSNVLLPNSSQAESSNTTAASMDLVSNGIKIRASTGINSGTWIYAAFAENPFKYALAR